MFSVRSRVPDSRMLIGRGMTPAVVSKRAVITAVTGEPLLFVAGGAGTARGLLLLLLHAASSAVDSARASFTRACMLEFLLGKRRARKARLS